MTYGYARVSTMEQNEDRQIIELRKLVEDNRDIIIDKATGRHFDRKGFNSLVGTEQNAPLLRKGDLLVISSLDRLGRNYTEIRKQWEHITKVIGADIRVLDMPLLDTSKTADNLDKRFIADLTLQILAYVAEKEYNNIKTRREQGINAMREVTDPTNGKVKRVSGKSGHFTGRPAAARPANWSKVYSEWSNKQLTLAEALKQTGLKRSTFYKFAKEEAERTAK